MELNRKLLGHKSYGHIAHLPGSRIGPGDHKCHEGQKNIACYKARDKHDRIIVQEKLDGSNVGVVMLNDEPVALTRAGYLATTSPYKMHHQFDEWVKNNSDRFKAVLQNGERICGEWLLVAHGTIYNLPHEPFVAFDIMKKKHERVVYDEFINLISLGIFVSPFVLSDGPPVRIPDAVCRLGSHGFHGAIDPAEGVVWRVERRKLNDKSIGDRGGRTAYVDFLVKFVHKDKKDGIYLDGDPTMNTFCN